jgi:hypothetical protein
VAGPDILAVHHAGDALHVGRNQNPHRAPLSAARRLARTLRQYPREPDGHVDAGGNGDQGAYFEITLS